MNYEQDWFMRQIKIIIDFTLKLMMTKRISNMEEVEEWEYNKYSKQMDRYLEENDINKAENILFEELDQDNIVYLKIGLEFYDRINKLSDIELKKLNFSREEIELGLKDLLKIYELEYMDGLNKFN